MTDKPKRRWYQYSLRSLFVVMTLFGIACSWYAYEMNEAAKRRAAIKEIEKVGSVYYYDASRSTHRGEPPAWYSLLRHIHGDKHLGNPVMVHLPPTTTLDSDLVHLKDLTNLEYVNLLNTRVTDAGMVNLKDLTKLKTVMPKPEPLTALR